MDHPQPIAYEAARRLSANAFSGNAMRLIRREHINSPAEMEDALVSKFRLIPRGLGFTSIRIEMVAPETIRA